jgi:hypothetical protein
MIKQYVKFLLIWKVRGAFKIKMKKANKKRTVKVRKVIIFLNFPRHCCLHQYKTMKAVATVAKVVLYPEAESEKLGKKDPDLG